MAIGWVGLYQLSIAFALAFIPFLMMIKSQTEEPQKQEESLLELHPTQ
jgi:PAT family beta-lactamase induction signal transducer AmpG